MGDRSVIQIKKPKTPPEKLATDGKRKRKTHCSTYSRDPSAYQSGVKKFNFDSNIYAHASVKQALIDAQHHKCCFCELLISDDGDVEHFRPKQAYCQNPGEPLRYPGYYWLAYDWSNLYLACSACNQRHKRNLFPLDNPDNRSSNHRENLDREQPLLIDPGQDNPEDYICFQGVSAISIDNNPRGNATIKLIKLNDRYALKEDRRQHLYVMYSLWRIIQSSIKNPDNLELKNSAEQANIMLEKCCQDTAKFSSVVRSALKTEFRYFIG
jgi:uncharacterized protein (TIGR02646 family)